MKPQIKRLYRSTSDRQLAGVCGGLAEFLGIDVTIVRVAFVIASLFGGLGLPVYLLMWIFVPEKTHQ